MAYSCLHHASLITDASGSQDYLPTLSLRTDGWKPRCRQYRILKEMPSSWSKERTMALESSIQVSEKAMAPHCSTLAWKIPWTEEPGRLQSMGSLESDMTERLHFHFSLSCIGKGNGNPIQCSCLENPRDGGAWWAAVYGVAQSRTRLK